ncbi:unnamed protein product, partial [Rangifer tarandus platyrhynchus]
MFRTTRPGGPGAGDHDGAPHARPGSVDRGRAAPGRPRRSPRTRRRAPHAGRSLRAAPRRLRGQSRGRNPQEAAGRGGAERRGRPGWARVRGAPGPRSWRVASAETPPPPAWARGAPTLSKLRRLPSALLASGLPGAGDAAAAPSGWGQRVVGSQGESWRLLRGGPWRGRARGPM